MEEVYKILSDYYDTLSYTGYIPTGIVDKILVLDYIKELVENPDFFLMATCEQQEKACKLYKCVTQNNCLL